MSNSKKKSTSCFSGILERFICTGNLPTHPSPPDEIVEKPEKINSFPNSAKKSDDSIIAVKPQVQVQPQAQGSPSIVARLMGLDSLPNYDNNLKSTTDYLFRSKSLNSLHFLPDFDPTRAAFHRRATSSASFREQGKYSNLLVKIDENLGTDGSKGKESEKGQGDVKQRKEKREKAVNLKGNECRKSRRNSDNKKRYQERYCTSTTSSRRLKNSSVDGHGSGVINNLRGKYTMQKRKLVNKERNVKVGPTVSSKRKVDDKQDMCAKLHHSDVLSRSPVSVLGHHSEFDSSAAENARQLTSTLLRQPSPKIRTVDDMRFPPQHIVSKPKENDLVSNKVARKHKSMKADAEIAEYFVELFGQICCLAEEQIREDSKWIRKQDLFKLHFVEDLCAHIGQEMLDSLLSELTDELSDTVTSEWELVARHKVLIRFEPEHYDWGERALTT